MTTVAAGVIVNGAYAEFIPGWLTSVESLNRAPDEVVAVTDQPRKFPSWVRTVKPPHRAFEWNAWRNHLAESCADHDYLAWVDVDDRYRPIALDGCDTWRADVVAYGMAYTGADGVYREWRPHDNAHIVAAGETNQIPNGSPVRVDLALRSPWDVRFWPFSDWGFWVQAACRGATFHATHRIDFDYRWHDDTPVDPEPTRREIAAWKAEEGLS